MDVAQNAWGWLRARTKEQRGRRNHEVVFGRKLKSDSQTINCKWPTFANKSIKRKVFLHAFSVSLSQGVASHTLDLAVHQHQRSRLTFTKLVSWSLNQLNLTWGQSDSNEIPQGRLLTWEQAGISIVKLSSCAPNPRVHLIVLMFLLGTSLDSRCSVTPTSGCLVRQRRKWAKRTLINNNRETRRGAVEAELDHRHTFGHTHKTTMTRRHAQTHTSIWLRAFLRKGGGVRRGVRVKHFWTSSISQQLHRLPTSCHVRPLTCTHFPTVLHS